MDWSTRRAQPHKHLAGIGAVVALHLLAVYALVNGLGRKAVEALPSLIETRIVDDVKKPPPPPERIVPPAPVPPKPKAALPPPPPPRVMPPQARVPAPAKPTLSAPAPAPAPPVETAAAPAVLAAPPAPAAPAAPPAPPAPAPAPSPPAAAIAQSVGIACPGHRRILEDAGIPREAQRAGVDSGDVKVEFIVATGGEIKDVKVVSSSDRLLNRGSVEAVRRFRCDGQARDVRVEVEIHYTSQ